MGVIWTSKGPYQRIDYKNEADLEQTILAIQGQLFGPRRIYLDVKKKMGAKGGVRNVPDGYLLDLAGPKPRLYVVENELAAHDPLRHIAVQILQFSLSFESEPMGVKRILFTALQSRSDVKKTCEEYALKHGFRNLDYLLESLVEAPFAALVVIDEAPDNLENVLSKKFSFPVEVLEVRAFADVKGDRVYQFEPFLADVAGDVAAGGAPDSVAESEVDTVVVPAREDGYSEVFLGERRWYAVRIHAAMRPQIKYVAGYQVAPISAITHLAPVESIEPWKDTNKVVINFAGPAQPVGPIPLVKGGKVRALQSLRYTTRKVLESAKTLDDIWGKA